MSMSNTRTSRSRQIETQHLNNTKENSREDFLLSSSKILCKLFGAPTKKCAMKVLGFLFMQTRMIKSSHSVYMMPIEFVNCIMTSTMPIESLNSAGRTLCPLAN